ncbi:arginine--tRNA ligase [Candidatus Pacearchaeota archaeon RBG_13_36_9]|nr:MAG: arginine--tRNA ligase [Candidatus Pacearchaeota archaeon RBG_13_36_9]
MFKEEIIKLLSKEVKLSRKEIENLIEVPSDSKLGDYAFPCFTLAKTCKKSPVIIAEEMTGKLETNVKIEKIYSAGPYINFLINKKKMADSVIRINDSYGRKKGKDKILLEHTSVNPNASPHVGRTRNSIIGDSIRRLLEFTGNKVETHYYVNDVSKQIAMLALVFTPKDKFGDLLGKYVEISSKIKETPELEKSVFELLHKFEHKDKKTTELFKKIVDTAIKGQKQIFSDMGIEFDYFDYESRYLESSKNILKELEATGKLFKDEEGRYVLDQKNTGVERSMKSPVLVLTRSDGTGLYPLRDLAYTIDKCKKGRNILILGEDQKLYFEQLKQALILLKKPYPEVVHYSFVLLKDSGKMSTRRGDVVLLSDFLAEATEKAKQEIFRRKTKGDAKKIAIGAVKYANLRNENNKNITFDWESALSFEGDSGPYLQYSYARAASILRKAKKPRKTKKHRIAIKSLEEKEIQLIKKIADFPETVERAANQLNPSLMANYSLQLAQSFNEFYHTCPVIGSKQETFRLGLVKAFRITMKNSLYLMGIDVMEEM